VKDGKDDVVTEDMQYFESLGDPRVYSRVVYTKAALFFKALRDAIGDQAFFAALQAYYLDNQYQVATGADLLASFEAASGKQLDELYKEWLYSKKE
jgi:aminopeptidase N